MTINNKQILLVSNAGPMRAQNNNGFLTTDTTLDGNFRRFTPFFKLRLRGTGVCTLYSREEDGTVSAVASYSSVGTDSFVYPYPGDDAVEIRATYTGDCSGEIV